MWCAVFSGMICAVETLITTIVDTENQPGLKAGGFTARIPSELEMHI